MSLRSEVVRIFNELLAGSKKISELDSLPSNVQNTDLIEVVRGSQNYKALGSQLPSGGSGSGDLQDVMDNGSSATALGTDVIVTTTENMVLTSGTGNVSQMVNPDGGSVTVGENVAVTGNAVVITASLGDVDLSSALAGTVKANGNPISSLASPSVDVTGTAISFAVPQIYGSDASPETGNITIVTTGLVKGMTQLLIHNNGTEPSYGAEIKIIAGEYLTGNLNYIMLMAVSSTLILVTISQEV